MSNSMLITRWEYSSGYAIDDEAVHHLSDAHQFRTCLIDITTKRSDVALTAGFRSSSRFTVL